MKISSPAFDDNQNIPTRYTCNGENFSPPLEFNNIPDNTQALVLIVDDPDASDGLWTHWLVWNIDPKTVKINEGEVPTEAIEGTNSDGIVGYDGPCPPSGTHHYYFNLYAIDTPVFLTLDANREELKRAIDNHILAHAKLVGLYQKQ